MKNILFELILKPVKNNNSVQELQSKWDRNATLSKKASRPARKLDTRIWMQLNWAFRIANRSFNLRKSETREHLQNLLLSWLVFYASRKLSTKTPRGETVTVSEARWQAKQAGPIGQCSRRNRISEVNRTVSIGRVLRPEKQPICEYPHLHILL